MKQSVRITVYKNLATRQLDHIRMEVGSRAGPWLVRGMKDLSGLTPDDLALFVKNGLDDQAVGLRE